MNTCPKCGKSFYGRPALSRQDNITLICPACGLKEAIDAMDVSELKKKELFEFAENSDCILLEDSARNDMDEYDYCYRTGNYTDQYCGICPHRYECSGYEEED